MLLLALLAPTVTMTFPGAPPAVVLREIATQTGDSYTATQEVTDDILTLQVTRIPAEELRERIARVISAKWRQPEKGHWILERPTKLAKEQQASEERERVSRIRTLVEDRYRALKAWDRGQISTMIASSAAASEDMRSSEGARQQAGMQRYMELRRENPAGRALRLLMHSLPDQDLAAVKPGDRLAYSTSPNRMQRSLGMAGKAALARFNQENEEWVRRVQAERYSAAPDRYSDPRYGPKVYRPATKLILSTRISTGAFSALLMAVDANGWAVGETMDYFPYQTSVRPELKGFKPASLEPNEEARAAKAAAFAWHSGQTSWDGFQRDAAWAKWKERFFAPDKHDPVSWWAGPCMIDLAKSQGLQLVACLPDYATDFVPDKVISGSEAESVANAAQVQWRVAFSVDQQCVEVKPALPVQARADRLRRAALASFAHEIQEHGANLDNVSAYVLAQPSLTALLQLDRMYVSPGIDAGGELTPREQFTFFNIPMLRLYGALSSQQRSALWDGGSFPASELSGAAKAALHRLAYGWNYRMPFLEITLPPQAEADVQLDHALQEATEALPNGVPGSTLLTGKPKTEQLPVGVQQYGEVIARYVISDKEVGEVFGGAPKGQEADAFKFYELADGRSLTLEIDFVPGVRLPWTFAEVRLHPEKRLDSFASLPRFMQEKALRAAEEYRASQSSSAAKNVPPQ